MWRHAITAHADLDLEDQRQSLQDNLDKPLISFVAERPCEVAARWQLGGSSRMLIDRPPKPTIERTRNLSASRRFSRYSEPGSY